MFSCIKDLLYRCKIAPSKVSPTQQSARATVATVTVTWDLTEASSARMQCIADALHCNLYHICTKCAYAVIDSFLCNLALVCSLTFWSSTARSSTPHHP